jgi:hypothetical protein
MEYPLFGDDATDAMQTKLLTVTFGVFPHYFQANASLYSKNRLQQRSKIFFPNCILSLNAIQYDRCH